MADHSTIKTLLHKHKSFIGDIVLNALAFGAYTVAQQIILLPMLAQKTDAISYADIIIFVSVINVLSDVFGGQLGVTRQICNNTYSDTDGLNDFTVILAGTSLLIATGLSIGFLIAGYGKATLVCLICIALSTNLRYYIRCVYRMNDNYSRIIVQNICYLLGIAMGLFLMDWWSFVWLPLLIGEAAALGYTIYTIWNNARIRFALSKHIGITLKTFLGFASAATLTNAVTLVDKLLVYPLLGAYSLAVYNAGSTIAKVSAFVINPLNDVVLVRLSKSKSESTAKVLVLVVKYSVISSAAIFALSVPVIYALSAILYKQYLGVIASIIIYLSIACAVGITTTIMKSFILKFAKTYQLSICYAINLGVLAILGWYGASKYGLVGFAIAMVLVRFELWVSFVIVLLRARDKELKNGE